MRNELVNGHIIVGIFCLSKETSVFIHDSMIRIVVMAPVCAHVTADTCRQLNKRGANQKALIGEFFSLVFQLIILSFDSPCNGSHPFWSLALSVAYSVAHLYYYFLKIVCAIYYLFWRFYMLVINCRCLNSTNQ